MTDALSVAAALILALALLALSGLAVAFWSRRARRDAKEALKRPDGDGNAGASK